MTPESSSETRRREALAEAPLLPSPQPPRTAVDLDPSVPGLFTANPVPMWIFDLDTLRILEVNAAACALYGYTRAEFLRLSILDLRPADERDAVTHHLRTVPPGLVQAGLWRHRRADGSPLLVDITSHAIEFGGRAARFVSARDVTERERVVHELGTSEARVRLLLEGSGDAIFLMDPSGERVEFATPSAASIYGYSPEEFRAHPGRCKDVVHPDDLPRVVEALQSLRLQPRVEVEYRIRHANGSSPWVHARMWMMKDAHGVACIAASVRDITESHLAQEQLRLANDELEARVQQRTRQLQELHREARSYAYTVAHDLRAPLRVLQGFSQLLRQEHEAELSGDARELLIRIGDAALKLDRIVNGHLTLAHLERHELQLERVDLRALVEDVVREQRGLIEGRRVEFAVRELPTVVGDAVLLRQLYSNLVSNALKFTREREVAHVECGAAERAGELALYVRDDGIGFDPAQAGTLFAPFHRLDERYEGTGIGLATVQRIVQRHEGRVWAEGEPGKGATLWFTLGTVGPVEARPAS